MNLYERLERCTCNAKPAHNFRVHFASASREEFATKIESIMDAYDQLEQRHARVLRALEELAQGDATYYITQERAMAPGSSGKWPDVIPAPHTKHGRLVKRDATAVKQEWRAYNDAISESSILRPY